MTNEEFERMYEENFEKAVAVVIRLTRVDFTRAQEAVQEAGLYISKRGLEGVQAPGHALLIRRAVQRAKNILRQEGHEVEGAGQDVPYGNLADLAEGEEAESVSSRAPSVWDTPRSQDFRSILAKANGRGLVPTRSDDFYFDVAWLRARGELEKKSFHRASSFGERGVPYCGNEWGDRWMSVDYKPAVDESLSSRAFTVGQEVDA